MKCVVTSQGQTYKSCGDIAVITDRTRCITIDYLISCQKGMCSHMKMYEVYPIVLAMRGLKPISIGNPYHCNGWTLGKTADTKA